MKSERVTPLPIAAVAALIVAMLVIAGLVIMATGLSDTTREEAEVTAVIEAIAAESSAVTNGYFAGPETVALVASGSLKSGLGESDMIGLLQNLTAAQPNIVGTYIGYPDGSFVDVRRETGSDELFRIKTIRVTDGRRSVGVEIVDPERGPIDAFELAEDTYDPRLRPWYVGVQDSSAHWSEPYLFFTSQEPGITHSVPILDSAGELVAVVGVDIALTDLQEFLAGRRPSANGGAAVLDSRGTVVAGATRLLDDPEGVEAIERLFAAGGARPTSTVRIERDEPHVIVATRVNAAGTQLLIVDAPESDFLRSIRSTRNDYAELAISLGAIGTILLLLGALMIRRYLGMLRRLAETDVLTGLLNRSAIYDRMSDAIDKGSEVVVVALDLDNFKLVNDKFGHDGGDQALIQVASRFTAASPDEAVVGRLGGDEFCMVLIDIANPHDVVQSVIDASIGPVKADKYTFDLELSAGYTFAPADGSASPNELLRQADVALYEAKALHGTSIIQFDQTMHMAWHRDDAIKESLVVAIADEQMELYFQPEFDLTDRTVVGAEGLLRWNHPERGVIAASHFIRDLERFDLLGSLLAVLFSSAETLAESVPATDPFTMRLNAATEQLLDPALIDHLERVTRSSHVKWCLEVTERAMVEGTPEVLAIFQRIRDLGVDIVLDDFGTGYSSLSELQQLPVDGIKIDRVFVTSLEPTSAQRSIAAILVDLAEFMEIEVVAEGIETDGEYEALVAIGCGRGQGYLLGKPVSVTDFVDRWGIHAQASAA